MIKMDPEDRDEAIKLYFDMGMLYKDIVQILTLEHGIIVSLRHLKRILKELGLFRRKNYSNIADVVEFVHNQLRNSGRLHGYRWMSEKCHLHNLRCKKEDVRLILSILDPEGNRQRRKRRLLRRSYYARGPNYIWHIDSYDKLKRCGICINGCVDGFSRRIVWMNSYHTSSDPQVVGGYYMEAVESLAGCPKIVRSDLGTENGHVKNIQTFLRMDDNFQEADLSYLEGPSTANQRIEYMWSFLRRECTDYWICLFQNMVDDGLFNGDFLDVNLMQFCFMHLIQEELDETMNTWNRHLIRPSRNARVPFGRPNIMYFLPGLYGATDCICNVSPRRVHISKEECLFRRGIPCDEDVHELCCSVMAENGQEFPKDPMSAVNLYVALKQTLSALLY